MYFFDRVRDRDGADIHKTKSGFTYPLQKYRDGSYKIRSGEYLAGGQIEQVICGGENYDGARPCSFDWVKELRAECVGKEYEGCRKDSEEDFAPAGRLPKRV